MHSRFRSLCELRTVFACKPRQVLASHAIRCVRFWVWLYLWTPEVQEPRLSWLIFHILGTDYFRIVIRCIVYGRFGLHSVIRRGIVLKGSEAILIRFMVAIVSQVSH